MKLAKMDLFATPESIEALQTYIHDMNGSERVLALTIMGMTWNLCAELTSEGEGESSHELLAKDLRADSHDR